ncbi:MAG: poly-gamma-glutamate hydrolase family protein [Candidatus Cloacimonetes bacterium]|nr:poly-gamma-glutamate hydrolase family protein [Candidatus Cloacimonadota bacterium]
MQILKIFAFFTPSPTLPLPLRKEKGTVLPLRRGVRGVIFYFFSIIILTSCSINQVSSSKSFYHNFKHLSKKEIEGKDFAIESQFVNSEISIIAPHSGGIEPGTYEITKAIALDDLNYYIFSGIKEKNNQKLHIPSEKFDEPIAIYLANKSKFIITIHGCQGDSDIIHIGGLDEFSKEIISQELFSAGFVITQAKSGYFSGKNPMNICNRSMQRKGVQLEISDSLRKKMFQDLSFDGRKTTTETFHRFVKVIKKAVEKIKIRVVD